MRAERRRPTRSSTLAENNRKTGSCPVLFTWNGERFVCLGDFLGGGGLGYLVAPGVYSQPDRDESVAIAADQLQAESTASIGSRSPSRWTRWPISISLTLDVVDRPPGVSATPDERFAPEGPRPTGELLAWRTAIEPVRATDLDGRDVTETLAALGPPHGRRLPQAATAGSATPRSTGSSSTSATGSAGSARATALVLCLAGWVEYPYSQTNYAAATAGVALKPPAIERLQRRRDLGGDRAARRLSRRPAADDDARPDRQARPARRCVLRIRTNMECY